MKRFLAFFIPFTLVCGLGLGLGLYWWIVGVSCDSHTPVDFFDLDPRTRCVTVTGMAHYEVVVTQTVEGNGFFEDQTYYVYGLFPKGNTDEREIRVLVRTQREPERMVSFEEMTISGRVGVLDSRKIPFNTERRMGQKSHYYFSDRVVLLEPESIAVDGEETWTLPE